LRNLLVIDDEPSICWGLKRLGESMSLEVTTCATAEEGLAAAEARRPDVVVLDVRLPGMSGLEAIDRLKHVAARTPVLLITAYGDLSTAVEAIRKDAFEFIVKPFDLEPMKRAITRALDYQPSLVAEEVTPLDVGGMVGSSAAMREVFRQIALAADSEAAVLLSGESGTGKELAARAIHAFSPRSQGPFIAVNVASLNPALAESELFGHVRGAFTGADFPRPGLLAQADGGTLFLDEVADISLPVQVKLLRALEHGEVLPVGGSELVQTNFRVITATHKRLLGLVTRAEFRHDLYFRLSAFAINLPPLREHAEDILPLAEHFLSALSERTGRPARLTAAARKELQNRPWYGNVRELRNAIEHAKVLARHGAIDVEHLPEPVSASTLPDQDSQQDEAMQLAADVERWAEMRLSEDPSKGQLYEELLRIVEPALLRAAVEKHHGQCLAAARELGIHRTTLRKKLDEYGLGDDS
jgi:DNA-binding NtrC family response regulator